MSKSGDRLFRPAKTPIQNWSGFGCAFLLSLITAFSLSSCTDKFTDSFKESLGGSFNDKHLVWVTNAPRLMRWNAPGSAGTPVPSGKLVFYSGGYHWKGQVYLYAVDAETGKIVWTSKDPVSDFLVDDDTVFATSRLNFFRSEPGRERKGWLYSLVAGDGKLNWKIQTETSNDVDLIGCKKSLYVVTDTQVVNAIDRKNGEVEWSFDVPSFGSKDDPPAITVSGDTIFTEYPDRSVLWYDASKAAILGRLKIEGPKDKGPRKFIYENGYLVITGTDGRMIWSEPEKHSVFGPIETGQIQGNVLVDGSSAYFCAQQPDSFENEGKSAKDGDSPHLVKLDLQRGKYSWRKKLTAPLLDAPIQFGKLIVAVTSDEKRSLLGFDKDTGALEWAAETGYINGKPVYKDGTIYVCATDALCAIDAKSGKIIWKVKPKEFGTSGGPALGGERVYFCGQDGNLYASAAEPERKN